jgi:hypothetical protein
MSVRAKFKVDAIEMTSYTADYEKTPEGKDDYAKPIKVTMYTVKASPVYGNGDPNHENTKFWKASPSGSLTLGTINEQAAKHFTIGSEVYVDFTPAG